MSRDKESKSIQEKLKQIFKINKGNPANIAPNKEFILTDEILCDLRKDAAISTRLKTMKELSEHVLNLKLETNGVEKLWSAIQDLFLDNNIEIRYAAFAFLQCIIKGQFEKIDIMRAQFFRFIKNHDNPADLAQRVELLCTLTNKGKEVEHFEEEIGPFLLSWMTEVNRVGKMHDFLDILENIIKFNSPHLDECIMTGYVRHLTNLCCSSNNYNTVTACLQILGTVVAYSILPSDCLPQFVGTLCRTVNERCYCPLSWKTMKNLLGTHMGHSALFTMCRFLQEPNLKDDEGILRGSVFFIQMALFDNYTFQNLRCPPNAVLPSILLAVKCNHSSVDLEVILGIQKLVNKHCMDLWEPSWSIILEILSYIVKQIDRTPEEKPSILIVGPLQDVLNTIENLILTRNFHGSKKQFFALIDECSHIRPETSVINLISFLSESIRSTENSWLQNLYNLLANYFKPDIPTNIRFKTLNVLSDVVILNRQYEEELMDRIVLPHFQNIANDENHIIRAEVAQLLINWCTNYNSNSCKDLLEILEKLLLRPFDKNPNELNEFDFYDIKILVPGMVQMFGKKIHRLPSTHAVVIHTMFMNFLEQYLGRPAIFKNCNQSRLAILECLLSMRANSHCRLGLPNLLTSKISYSTYIVITYKNTDCTVGSPPPTSPTFNQLHICKITYLNLEGQFRTILTFLEREKDWEVLKVILEKLPEFLANKQIVLAKHGNSDLNKLVQGLCTMLQNKAILENLNTKVSRLEFQTVVVNALVSLSSYNISLDQFHQQVLINTLTRCVGIDPRCSRQSINSLTICMVDMRDTMMKLLPEVLLRLSKISASMYIAMPILEFLSTLSQLPTVYANFVSDQYMAVFAIALPYTNPFKYDNYVVSLAYHVISVWFLKCRLPFRKDFVKFIVSGLQTNVMVPFQELNQFKYNLSSMNQDSSDRKRSSSLTEQGSRRRMKPEAKSSSFIQKTRDKTVLNFYEELNETCIDLMARYTYSPCSALPARLPTAEFLLNGGISKSWMVGNKLITITTSGCTEKVLKRGVCDKCWSICGHINDNQIARFARSNSNNDEKDKLLNRQSSSEKSEDGKKPESGPKLLSDDKIYSPLCACWCQGWAEVFIRRPTGNVSWVMRVQNSVSFKQLVFDFPLNDISTLYMPELNYEPKSATSIEEKEENEGDEMKTTSSSSQPIQVPSSPGKTLSRQSSHDSADDDAEFEYDDGTKARNPVRRSNSSPEMANWKNPFVHQKTDDSEVFEDDATKKKKDVRVSCEAIPEEISGTGTSPPNEDKTNQVAPQHPSLLSCHSYPGSSPPVESNIEPKPYKTVPASPNLAQGTTQPNFSTSSSERMDRPNNLPNLANLAPLAGKPPQSPTQTSPRLPRHSNERDAPPIQKSSSSSKVEKGKSKVAPQISDPTLAEKRDRLHTISVMNTSRKPTSEKMRAPKKVPKEILKSGLNPSFVFLQLYHTASFGDTNEVPLLVHQTAVIERAITMLDRMYPYEVHKIGVLYINEGQHDKETEILRNTAGSLRYMEFLQKLGSLIRLADVDPHNVFLGGLQQNGNDGKYMYMHQDDLVMLAFHVATMMPNKESDPQGNNKKAHVGNDNVVIVYNNSKEEFDIATFKSQVTLAYIIVEPLDYNCHKVEVKVKSDLLKIIGSNEVIVVTDDSASIFVRQLALHADLAATVLNSLRSHSTDPYASNWLERLRKLKNLREKVIEEIRKQKDAQKGFSEEKDIIEDFTDFT